MKLSTKTRYGTRAMVYLALNEEDGPVSVREIAADQSLSPKYLEHLMSDLHSAGLVRSTRGPNGGYSLAQPSDRITLRAIYEVLEGTDSLVECTANPELCTRADTCVTQEVWAEMQRALFDVLESHTIADLKERWREKTASPAPMYQI